MISAALVAGNTVVFKPSDAAGLTGRLVVEALVAGGLPDGVLNLVHGGRADRRGARPAPRVDGFAFTGSNAVGMTILRQAASAHSDAARARRDGRQEPGVCRGRSADLALAAIGRRAVGVRAAGPEMQRRVEGLCRARRARRFPRRAGRDDRQARGRRPAPAGRLHGAGHQRGRARPLHEGKRRGRSGRLDRPWRRAAQRRPVRPRSLCRADDRPRPSGRPPDQPRRAVPAVPQRACRSTTSTKRSPTPTAAPSA